MAARFWYREVPGGTFCLTGYEGDEAHVVLPRNVRISIVGDNVFRGHAEIESVDIPDTVTQMGGFAFDGCTRLRSLRLPPHLEDLWQYALARTGIEEIEIPGSVRAIIPFTFFESKALETVRLHAGTRRVEAWAFQNCTALTDVYLDSSRTEIQAEAFDGCGDVTVHRA